MRTYQKLGIVLFGFTVISTASAQTCRDQIPQSTPTEQFIIHDDGTVTDIKTGLMWQRCGVGQSWDGSTCSGFSAYTVAEIFDLAKLSDTAGHNDWRIPNIKELFSIVESSCRAPAVNLTVFPGTSSNVTWSSTPSVSTPGQYQAIFFMDGQIGDFWTGNRLRLVRDLEN